MNDSLTLKTVEQPTWMHGALIAFSHEEVEIGKVLTRDGQVVFEGDPTESAKIFWDCVRWHGQTMLDRIAQHEATIAELRREQEAWRKFTAEAKKTMDDAEATIAELQRQQKTDLEAWCNLVMQCGLPTGHADDLQGLLREAGPYFLKMSEQLARMPVCAGYVTPSFMQKIRFAVSVSKDHRFQHPIYIDAPAQPASDGQEEGRG